ncbi:hypothetical protein [Cyanobium sp. N5-Cardenillas]|uniref:hypothetical protein n=1 Tax=Cyanobium sp. N5-Cardenillas TaxID=2823720 RepID=UPI0020CC52AB|nr:hypothetical protein [Cyanobium sp. N5-Cardenillas]MCP9786788.1 hypothetical protein [Cyanobium sp. N5-Cardenillas]
MRCPINKQTHAKNMAPQVRLLIHQPPVFESTSMFCLLTKETREAILSLPRVHQRSVACLRFLQQISNPSLVSEEHKEIMRVAYLRAALMELVGMEEMLDYDLEERGQDETPLQIKDTECAMLILLRELRHLQLHLVTSTFSREPRDAVYRGGGEGEIATTITINLIPLEDLIKIKELKNARRYNDHELDAAIEWLNQVQLNWGIADVLQRGVQKYADALVEEYHLLAT